MCSCVGMGVGGGAWLCGCMGVWLCRYVCWKGRDAHRSLLVSLLEVETSS